MFWEEKDDGIILRVRLTPSASAVGFKGVFRDADGIEYIKVGVLSAPEKGKANKELSSWLAKIFKLPKSALRLLTGETSHYKKIFLQGELRKLTAILRRLEEEQTKNDGNNN